MSPGTAEFLSALQAIYLAVELWAMVELFVTRRFQRPSGNYLGVVLTLSFLTDAFVTLSVHFLHLGQTINAVANTNGNNIWLSTKGESYPDGILGDWGYPCPPNCHNNE